MTIKILGSGLPRVGYAKIGAKSKAKGGAPVKYDHIELTTVERDVDGLLVPDVPLMLELIKAGAKTCGGCSRSKELAQKWDEPDLEKGLPCEIGILLPYDDIEANFPSALNYWRGGTRYCTGDGATAERLEIVGEQKKGEKTYPVYGDRKPYAGPTLKTCGNGCPDFESRRCKPQARLRFVLGLQASIGGVYEWGTTSWNSIRNLTEALQLVKRMASGQLSWIPLIFDVVPQTVRPKQGPPNTAYIARVRFDGTPRDLIEKVHETLSIRAPMMAEVRQLEATIRESAWDISEAEVDEFRREFDHENLQQEEPAVEVDGAPQPGGEVQPPSTDPATPDAEVMCGKIVRVPNGESGELQPCTGPYGHEGECSIGTPFDRDEPLADADDPPLTREQLATVWGMVKARASMFPKPDEKRAARILQAVLRELGYEKSTEIPQSRFIEFQTLAKNAKDPA